MVQFLSEFESKVDRVAGASPYQVFMLSWKKKQNADVVKTFLFIGLNYSQDDFYRRYLHEDFLSWTHPRNLSEKLTYI